MLFDSFTFDIVINLKNRQTELVSVTQIYGGKVIRCEDGVLPAQRKRQWHDGKNVRLILRFHSISSSFLNSRASTVCRNRGSVHRNSDCTSNRTMQLYSIVFLVFFFSLQLYPVHVCIGRDTIRSLSWRHACGRLPISHVGHSADQGFERAQHWRKGN